jgi:hypothetical protein
MMAGGNAGPRATVSRAGPGTAGPHFPRGPRRPTARTAGNPRIVAFSAPRSKAIPYANVLERCDALARSTDQGGLQAQNRSLGNRCSLLDTVHPFRERHSPEALVGAANCLGAVVAVETTHTETADCCRQLAANYLRSETPGASAIRCSGMAPDRSAFTKISYRVNRPQVFCHRRSDECLLCAGPVRSDGFNDKNCRAMHWQSRWARGHFPFRPERRGCVDSVGGTAFNLSCRAGKTPHCLFRQHVCH